MSLALVSEPLYVYQTGFNFKKYHTSPLVGFEPVVYISNKLVNVDVSNPNAVPKVITPREIGYYSYGIAPKLFFGRQESAYNYRFDFFGNGYISGATLNLGEPHFGRVELRDQIDDRLIGYSYGPNFLFNQLDPTKKYYIIAYSAESLDLAPKIVANIYPEIISGSAEEIDPHYSSVVLLVHADGAHGSQAITDYRAHTIAAYAGTYISSSKYKFGTSSIYFDGSSTSKVTTTSPDYEITNQDFTIEMWLMPDSSSIGTGYRQIINRRLSSGNTTPWFIQLFNGKVDFGIYKDGWVSRRSSATLEANKWSHIAFVRSGSSFKLYINGALDGSFTSTKILGTTTDPICLGSYINGSATDAYRGYMDEIRITIGTARYLSNFVVANKQFPGDKAYVPSTIDEYRAYVSAHSHFDGIPNDTNITDTTGKTLTIFGTPKLSSDAKFGNTSLYFDGTPARVEIPHSTDLVMENSDFTIEFWMKTSATNECALFSKRANYTQYVGYSLLMNYQNSSGYLTLIYTFGGPPWIFCNVLTSVNDNQWHHITFQRNGTVFIISIDGIVSTFDSTSNASLVDNGAAFTIGAAANDNYTPYTGLIDEFRITKGVARYPNGFTRPSAAFYEDSPNDYKSLIVTGRPFAYWPLGTLGTIANDVTGYRRHLNLSGTQNIGNTFSTLNGGAGNKFNSSNTSYASRSNDTSFSIKDDLTIEAWLSLDSLPTPGTEAIFVAYSQDGETEDLNSPYWLKVVNVSGTYGFEIGQEYGAGTNFYAKSNYAVAVNTNYHVVMTRNATTREIKWYVNGSQIGATINYTAGEAPTGGTNTSMWFALGRNAQAAPYYFNGTMDEVAMYKRVLPASEILSHYNKGISG